MSASDLAPWIAAQATALLAQRGHAWLLAGPSGLGQYSLALTLVRAWLCEQPSAQGACGQCSSCHAIDVRTHADLCVLMPETVMLGCDSSGFTTISRLSVMVLVPSEISTV